MWVHRLLCGVPFRSEVCEPQEDSGCWRGHVKLFLRCTHTETLIIRQCHVIMSSDTSTLHQVIVMMNGKGLAGSFSI